MSFITYIRTGIRHMFYQVNLVVTFSLLFFIPSCDNFVEIEPPNTQLVTEEVFSDDQTAISATLGMYEKMMESSNSVFNGRITLYAGLSSDELISSSTSVALNEFFINSIAPTNNDLRQFFWNPAYSYIYHANSIILGLSNSNGVSLSLKNQLMGEAMFVRAFSHFYLSNFFGKIPYVTSTDYNVNLVIGKSDEAGVSQLIISDLVNAIDLLGSDYISDQRVRPNKMVAKALLARVYLFSGNWDKAEALASEVIDSKVFALESDLNNVFLANSFEAIWQMQPVIPGLNTSEGFTFITTSGVPAYGYLSSDLVNSFESNDKRKDSWTRLYTVGSVSYNQPFKYKVQQSPAITEYYTVFRLAEQFLIRAEARAKQGKLSEAIMDLDVIRQRAALPLIQSVNPGMSQQELLNVIAKERRVELFAEWGHRWLDLKRTNRADEILSPLKSLWQSTDVLYPIPEYDLLNNPNLLPQNPGY